MSEELVLEPEKPKICPRCGSCKVIFWEVGYYFCLGCKKLLDEEDPEKAKELSD